MKKTEKQYWVNGYQVRGKNFKTFTISIGNIGIMISNNGISLYKLVPYIKYNTLEQVFESDWSGITNPENKY
jgi:hypothetical protein